METERITIARAALAWFGAGWHVLELPPGSKAPPPDGRTGAAGVDMTAAEVALARWAGNLGVRMPAGVIGLDVDDYDGKPGAATLDALTVRLGPLPLTWRSSNGRPGRSGIRLFAVPESMRWVAGLPGIEIVQRTHRYAVVWPSMHPEGRQYVLVDELADEPAERIPGREDLPELPWPWIAELSRANDGDELTASTAVSTSEGAEFLDLFDVAAAPGYALVIVDDFMARVRSGRSRHDSMQHALIWSMESARAGIVGALPAINALAEAWRSVMDVPRRLEIVSASRTTEFDAMLRHAIGKATAKPQREIDALADAVIGIPIAPGTPTKPPGVPAPWGLDADDESEPPGDGDPLPLVWADAWKHEPEERAWLVEGFWPTGRQMVVWAAAKTGKSELALWVAAHMAIGRHPFTGAPIEPTVVAYLDYEMTLDDLLGRLDDLGLRDVPLDRLRYYLLPAMHALDEQAGGAQLERMVTRDEARAVVVDTFGRAVLGREDEADTVRAFYRHTGQRLKRAGIGLLRLDHAGKVEERGQRGSSAKRDDVDVIWRLTRSKAGGPQLDCSGSSRLSYVGPSLSLDRIVGRNGTSYSAPLGIDVGPSKAVVAKIAELDRLHVDVSLGRDAVRDLMKAADLTPGTNDVISEAITRRRERSKLSGGQAPDQSALEDSRTGDGQ